MKQITFLLIVLVVFHASGIMGQNLIAVQNGGTPVFYQQVDSAIIHSQNGDTIYIPGGAWNITQPINKRLYIIGVGHHPDSSYSTFTTTLIGNLVLGHGACYGSFTGIYLQGGITRQANDSIDYYIISRCHVTGGVSFECAVSDFYFIENIIDGDFGCHSNNLYRFSFFNNIFTGTMWNSICALWWWSPGGYIPFVNSIFKNNIFLSVYWQGYDWNYGYYSCFNISSQYSLFENNIIFNTNALSGVTNSIFNNNLFIEQISFQVNTNNGYSNISNQEQSTIFVNLSGNTFSYNHDYHLKSISPGKNAGTDGSDIGIYGGFYPWKEGSIPFNPHIQFKNISSNTDQNGNLNVNIKVKAQDH